MTYEEYLNEIEDFDDITKQELISDFQNLLPLDNPSMMQQMGYNGFQNFLKTENNAGVLQLGESFRGMNNVSPLLAMKLTNQTSKDIANKYFLDGDPPEEGTFTYVSDIRSDLTQYIKDVGDFYYYGKQEKDLFAFKVILFSSTEATKLKECFEVCTPKGREILIFVEDNSTDSVSGTYGAVRISQDVLDYLNPKNRLAYDLHDNEGVYEYIQRSVPELTDEQIRSLFHKGYIEDTGIELVKGFFKMASFLSSAISTMFPSLAIFTNPAARAATSFLLEKAIEEIETARLGENRWQPKAPKKEDGSVDTSYQYQPLISLGQNENGVVNITQAVKTLKDMLAAQRAMVQNTLQIKNGFKPSTEPSSILEYLYSKYLKAYSVAWNVLGNIEELSELEILKQGVKIYNSLICGVWNGLVDAVSGLFAMVKMIYDGITLGQDFVQNIDKYLPTLLEQFDEALQAIENISFSDTAKYIYGKLEQINLTFDPVACAYFVGYAYGFIISLIIEIVVGILISGGTLSVAAIAKAFSDTVIGIFRLGFGAVKGALKAVRTFAKFVVKSIEDLIKGFQELVNFLKKGWQEMKKVIDEAFEITEIEFKEFRRKKRVELFSTIKGKPINLKLLKKLQKEFENIGGALLHNDESFEYIASREKIEGVDIEAITFNEELILLNKNATTSAVYEELIHATQYRTGKYDAWVTKHGNEIAKNLMEKEAAEELIERAAEWKLPKEEIKLIKERLEFFNEELKILGYEN